MVTPFRSSHSLRFSEPPSLALIFWKRAFDLTCCLLALPLLAFCTVVVGVVTRLASPGPIFYRQQRVGARGHRFGMYRFRTRDVNAASAPGSNRPTTSIPGGRFLRDTGLAALPQIINVLRGEMTIVGPRPRWPDEFDHAAPEQRAQAAVAPGVTGLWLVSDLSGAGCESEAQLDATYAQHQSLWLDVQIVLRTLPTLVLLHPEAWRGSFRSANAGVQATRELPLRAKSASR